MYVYHISSSETRVFLVQKRKYISKIKFSVLNLTISSRTRFSDNHSFECASTLDRRQKPKNILQKYHWEAANEDRSTQYNDDSNMSRILYLDKTSFPELSCLR